MTPLEHYLEKIRTGIVIEDANQLSVMNDLQHVYVELIEEHRKRSGFFSFARSKKLIKGLYVWGGVGIGKTFLMDCFYNSIPFDNKMRMHFHVFMKMVHEQLKYHRGEKDPLDIIARDLAAKAMILCFDELVVSEIGDAMLLARMFKALFNQGVTLVLTSNTKPDDLYYRGLQRDQFLPAIALLKKHTKVVHLPTLRDYRLHLLEDGGVYYTPNDQVANNKMEKLFQNLATGHEQDQGPIQICERDIPVLKHAGDIVWFDFNIICSPPRSQLDYLSIAEKFHIIFISNIPVIPETANNTVTLFIRLIDVLYDAGVKLVFSSEQPVSELYQEGLMKNDWKRTQSRLMEMQSRQYFLK